MQEMPENEKADANSNLTEKSSNTICCQSEMDSGLAGLPENFVEHAQKLQCANPLCLDNHRRLCELKQLFDELAIIRRAEFKENEQILKDMSRQRDENELQAEIICSLEAKQREYVTKIEKLHAEIVITRGELKRFQKKYSTTEHVSSGQAEKRSSIPQFQDDEQTPASTPYRTTSEIKNLSLLTQQHSPDSCSPEDEAIPNKNQSQIRSTISPTSPPNDRVCVDEVNPDGNCLFRAIIRSLRCGYHESEEHLHQILRYQIACHLQQDISSMDEEDMRIRLGYQVEWNSHHMLEAGIRLLDQHGMQAENLKTIPEHLLRNALYKYADHMATPSNGEESRFGGNLGIRYAESLLKRQILVVENIRVRQKNSDGTIKCSKNCTNHVVHSNGEVNCEANGQHYWVQSKTEYQANFQNIDIPMNQLGLHRFTNFATMMDILKINGLQNCIIILRRGMHFDAIYETDFDDQQRQENYQLLNQLAQNAANTGKDTFEQLELGLASVDVGNTRKLAISPQRSLDSAFAEGCDVSTTPPEAKKARRDSGQGTVADADSGIEVRAANDEAVTQNVNDGEQNKDDFRDKQQQQQQDVELGDDAQENAVISELSQAVASNSGSSDGQQLMRDFTAFLGQVELGGLRSGCVSISAFVEHFMELCSQAYEFWWPSMTDQDKLQIREELEKYVHEFLDRANDL